MNETQILNTVTDVITKREQRVLKPTDLGIAIKAQRARVANLLAKKDKMAVYGFVSMIN